MLSSALRVTSTLLFVASDGMLTPLVPNHILFTVWFVAWWLLVVIYLHWTVSNIFVMKYFSSLQLC